MPQSSFPLSRSLFSCKPYMYGKVYTSFTRPSSQALQLWLIECTGLFEPMAAENKTALNLRAILSTAC